MRLKYVHLFGFMIIFFITGCAVYRTTAMRPELRPVGKDIDSYVAQVHTAEADRVSSSQETPDSVLVLPQAISLALIQNPALAAFSYEIRAAEARALQASLYPNPEAGIELENFAGSGAFSRTGELETTLWLGQSILLGGKRYKRTRAAALEGDLAAWDYESARLDLLTEVRRIFIKVVAAQERVNLNKELVRLSEQLLKIISDRVKAGKISPAEESRARVILSGTQVELEHARRQLDVARRRLAATWGSQSPKFNSAAGRLDTLFAIPTAAKLEKLLSQNPDLARFATELKQRQAVIALEDALRIPDPTISGGVRRLNGTDDNAFVAGISIPLPLSDRNQGARQEARYRLTQTLREKQAAEVQLSAALSQAYNNLQSAFNEASILKNQILPEAQNAYNVINDGYLMGRFDFLDVLDAQRTLFEARGQYLRALSEFHTAIAEIERLIAQEINTN